VRRTRTRGWTGPRGELERQLSGARRPAFVVLYQRIADLDRSARLSRLLAANYVADRRAPRGLPPILVRRDGE
jgi:hypothetical protein